MARKVGIMAYGVESDREKLEVLALLSKGSSSSWLINVIRSQYKEVYGETDPKEVLNGRGNQRGTSR
jgi:hypothetical protein